MNEDPNANSFRPGAGAPVLIAGKYEVIGELGRGGFGTVYQARQTGLNKLVAVKVLHAALLVDQSNKARFELEAKAGANLSHPNLVSVFDYGFTEQHEPYLVMEFAEGISLEQFLLTQSPKADDLLDILIQIGKALRYLHDANIVHRDLKTSNILVQNIGGERYAKLLDLGIAKVFSPNGGKNNVQLTSTGMIFGSPAFMSPEQCQGYVVDARSDIYSFGCVIYQCLSGDYPFSGENSLQVILKHLHETPKPLQCKTLKDSELAQVVTKCLAKEPGQRYQTMKELLDALQKIAAAPAQENAHARPGSASRSYLETSSSSENRQQVLSIVSLVALVILVVACLIPLCGLLAAQFSKGVEYSVRIPPATPVVTQPATVLQQAVNVQPVPAGQAIHPMTNDQGQQNAVSGNGDQLRRDQEALTAKMRETSENLAKQEREVKEATALLKERQALEVRNSLERSALLNETMSKVQLMGKANEAGFQATTQKLQEQSYSIDQATQNLQRTTNGWQQYNGQLSEPSRSGR